jgi:hypothetical protein
MPIISLDYRKVIRYVCRVVDLGRSKRDVRLAAMQSALLSLKNVGVLLDNNCPTC